MTVSASGWMARTPVALLPEGGTAVVDVRVVAEAHVGKAIVLKRFTPRGRGRAGRIFKPFANLTIVVRQVEASA